MEEKMTYRESAFIIIFENMFLCLDDDELFDIASNIDNVSLSQKTWNLVKSVRENQENIENVISSLSEKRSVQRIPRLNKAILYIAIAEVLYNDKVPTNVAISEAVNIAKKYALESDVKFINGLLGSFSKSL